MKYAPTSPHDPPIRLFESDFMEAFTHIRPGVVVALWTPVALWFLWRSPKRQPSQPRRPRSAFFWVS
ncbi:MAG: hypothetical protein AB7N65_05855 [Vicinamibacterales bacterium]